MERKNQQTNITSISEVEALLQRIRDNKFIDGNILLIERVIALFISN